MKFVIDRFEGDIAICEPLDKGDLFHVKKALLPDGAREGDVLVVLGYTFVIDINETARRKENIQSMLDVLFGKKDSQ